MAKRKILVTSALLYANGPLHLGHIVEQIQTDIWVRFQRLRGHLCTYVSGDDAHGTPIMLAAEKAGVDPESLIANIGKSHQKDLTDFHISVDNYYTTHSSENKELSEYIYQQLDKNGDIKQRTIEQAFDPIKKMFLPDRFIKGECPRCHSKDQYGDNCENCGATYAPTELINPRSSLSGATPELKESVHYFFQLEKYAPMLREWIQKGHLQAETSHKLQEWLKVGLQPWDISRDAPYFGFKIPGTSDKYFYVWLDAPIGYMASFKNLCARKPHLNFDDYWKKNNETELYHFIGKDIIYFHGLFWPAMLKGAGFRTPTAIYTHGFLTIEGQKMSKSRGTFIKARTYLDHLNPEYLRYYFAAKLSNTSDDLDLNFHDFMLRVNADLVGKVVNIASRSAAFIHKHYDNTLSAELDNPNLFQDLYDEAETIAHFYETREYNQGIRKIMELADNVNQYIDAQKPWALIKDDKNKLQVQAICSTGLNCFRQLIIYLQPILPTLAKAVADFLNCKPFTWEDIAKPLLQHQINPFKPLMTRIEQAQIDALKQAAIADIHIDSASRHATS